MRLPCQLQFQLSMHHQPCPEHRSANHPILPPAPCSGVTMAETLSRLGPRLELAPMQESIFVKPHSIMFDLDGVRPFPCSSF